MEKEAKSFCLEYNILKVNELTYNIQTFQLIIILSFQDEYSRPISTHEATLTGWAKGAIDVINMTKKVDDTNGGTSVYLTRSGESSFMSFVTKCTDNQYYATFRWIHGWLHFLGAQSPRH